MKKLIIVCTVLSILLIGSILFAYDWKSADYEEPKIIPQYLLVIRYWGNVLKQQGGALSSSQGWTYMKEVYDSLDEVVNRLQTYTGQGMSAKEKQYALIGLWKLGEDGNIADKVLELKETIHEKKVEVQVKEWTEIKWSMKKAAPGDGP